MGDEDDGAALAVFAGEKLGEGSGVGLVEIPGGLVGQDDLRFGCDRAGHGDPLLFAHAQLSGEMRQAVGHPKAGRQVNDSLFVVARVASQGE